MPAESVKVIVRSRPLTQDEYNLKCKSCLMIDSSRGQCSIKNLSDDKSPAKNFFFDGSYDENSTTDRIYSEIAYPLVEGVCEGYNGTIFAYGQTGCGKSFTMQGIIDPPTQKGVIPRLYKCVSFCLNYKNAHEYLLHL